MGSMTVLCDWKSSHEIESAHRRPVSPHIASLLQAARQSVTQTLNHAMVTTYYDIGKMIVEEECHGQARAAYGQAVLEDLSQRLTRNFGKGFSVVNLRQMRSFFLAYSIQQTPSAELPCA